MTQNLVYDIPDMHCKKCANVIKLALDYTAGVEKTEIKFSDRNAIVSIDPKIISKKKIKAIIIALGFSAMLL
jgi:copper chaperone CopZ